jgi:anti-sigma factor RsiW
MVEMTHQQIRNLLQASAEQTLPPSEKLALEKHISDCAECRTYAQQLSELQSGLRQMLHQRWDKSRPTLSAQLIKERAGKQTDRTRVWAMVGKLAVVPLLVIAFFVAYQASEMPASLMPATALSIPAPEATLLTPTPPARSTPTQITAQNCDRITYIIQENDSLDSIAAQFSVTKDMLMAYNGMGSESLVMRTELVIPLCQSTSTPTITSTP